MYNLNHKYIKITTNMMSIRHHDWGQTASFEVYLFDSFLPNKKKLKEVKKR